MSTLNQPPLRPFARCEPAGHAVSGRKVGSYEVDPQVARDADPAARAGLFDLGAVFPLRAEDADGVGELLVGAVAAILVRQDPRDADFGGGAEELGLHVRRGHHGQGDDEGILALQCRFEEGVGRVIALLHRHIGREGRGRLLAGNGGDVEDAALEHALEYRAAD